MTVLEKLLQVQSKLKAPKSQYNTFGKYSYRNCEDILEAVKPLCLEVNAVVTIRDKPVQRGDRYYIEATAVFHDCESSQQIIITAYAREEESKKGMDSSQVTGSTSSYARKYALNGLFAIDDTKDSDTTNTGTTKKNTEKNENGQSQKTTQSDPTITETMLTTLKKEIEKAGVSIEKILPVYNLKNMNDMRVTQYESCMNKLQITIKAKEGTRS